MSTHLFISLVYRVRARMKIMVAITETFYPKNRGEWRNWLSQHHATKKEIWLVYYKKHTGKLTVTYQDAVLEALCFGWIDGIEKRIDDEQYAGRFSPRRPKSSWTETNIGKYKKLLKEGFMTKAGTRAFEDKKKSSKYITEVLLSVCCCAC